MAHEVDKAALALQLKLAEAELEAYAVGLEQLHETTGGDPLADGLFALTFQEEMK